MALHEDTGEKCAASAEQRLTRRQAILEAHKESSDALGDAKRTVSAMQKTASRLQPVLQEATMATAKAILEAAFTAARETHKSWKEWQSTAKKAERKDKLELAETQRWVDIWKDALEAKRGTVDDVGNERPASGRFGIVDATKGSSQLDESKTDQGSMLKAHKGLECAAMPKTDSTDGRIFRAKETATTTAEKSSRVGAESAMVVEKPEMQLWDEAPGKPEEGDADGAMPRQKPHEVGAAKITTEPARIPIVPSTNQQLMLFSKKAKMQMAADAKTKTPCKFFLEGACLRKVCPYAHPPVEAAKARKGVVAERAAGLLLGAGTDHNVYCTTGDVQAALEGMNQPQKNHKKFWLTQFDRGFALEVKARAAATLRKDPKTSVFQNFQGFKAAVLSLLEHEMIFVLSTYGSNDMLKCAAVMAHAWGQNFWNGIIDS